MKRLRIILILILLALASEALAITHFSDTAISGAGTRSLKSCATMTDGDRSTVTTADGVMFFEFDAASTATENLTTHPYIVQPTTGSGRWVEVLPPVSADDVASESRKKITKEVLFSCGTDDWQSINATGNATYHDNILVNPALDTWDAGLPTGWTTYSTATITEEATIVHTAGGSACKTEIAAKWRGLQTASGSPFSVVSGYTYYVSLWVYVTAGSPDAKMDVQIRYNAGATTHQAVSDYWFTDVAANKGGWVHWTGSFTASGSYADGVVRIYVDSDIASNFTFYVDDTQVQVNPVRSEGAVGESLRYYLGAEGLTITIENPSGWDLRKKQVTLFARTGNAQRLLGWSSYIRCYTGSEYKEADNGLLFPVGYGGNYFDDEWWNVAAGQRGFTGAGTIDWSNITKIEFFTDIQSGYNSYFEIDEISLESNVQPGMVGFRFDDSVDDHYTQAYKILSDNGMRGIVAVMFENIGESGYMTLDQIVEMDRAGWDMAIHGHAAEENWAQAPYEDIRNIFIRGQRILQANGCYKGARFAIAPNGGTDSVTPWSLKEIGKRFCAGFAYQGADYAALRWNPYNIHYQGSVSTYSNPSVTFPDLKAVVDDVKENGGLVWLTFHQIQTTASGLACDIAGFTDFVEYVKASGVKVVTMSDVYDMMVAVPAPAVNAFEDEYLFTVTDDTTVTDIDYNATILINAAAATGDDLEINLPDCSANHGMPLTLKAVNVTDAISINTAGTDTIEGAAGSGDYEALDTLNETVKFKCDGASNTWRIIE